MTSRRITLSSLCLLALLPPAIRAQSTDAPPAPRVSVKGVDCKTLPTRESFNDCLAENAETKIIYLTNVSQANDANEILVAVRNIADPSIRLYLVASQNALVVRSYPQDLARIESLVHDLDKSRKVYRLTYTVAIVEDGKNIGVQHYSLVATDGQRTTLKEGDKVPVATGSYSTENATSQTQFTYLDVGMNFDATPSAVVGGVSLKSKVEQSSIGTTNTIAGVAEPVVRQSVLEGSSVVAFGKPLMLGSIDIPNTTRHLDVDVMIEPLK